jgi:hypothetical protein
LKSVYIQSRHFVLCRKSLKKSVDVFDTESLKVGCEIGLFPGFKCKDMFFGNSYHYVCDCNVVTLACMWGSKKVTKSTTCTATCWDGTYRQTSKLWLCSEVKSLLFMNLSGSLPMEFQWQELWKYWRRLWHNIKGQDYHSGSAIMRSLNAIIIWIFQSEDNLNASVGIM